MLTNQLVLFHLNSSIAGYITLMFSHAFVMATKNKELIVGQKGDVNISGINTTLPSVTLLSAKDK